MSYSNLSVRIILIFSFGKIEATGMDTILLTVVALYTGKEAQRESKEEKETAPTAYMQKVQESLMNCLRLLILKTIGHS